MATELLLVRQLGSLRGADSASDERLRGLAGGRILRGVITTPHRRNILWHNKFFAFLDVLYQNCNQQIYPTPDRLRKAIMVALGFSTTFPLPDGRVVVEADSMSIPKMDEEEFTALMHRFIDLAVTQILPGIDRADVWREWQEIDAGYRNSSASLESHLEGDAGRGGAVRSNAGKAGGAAPSQEFVRS